MLYLLVDQREQHSIVVLTAFDCSLCSFSRHNWAVVFKVQLAVNDDWVGDSDSHSDRDSIVVLTAFDCSLGNATRIETFAERTNLMLQLVQEPHLERGSVNDTLVDLGCVVLKRGPEGTLTRVADCPRNW